MFSWLEKKKQNRFVNEDKWGKAECFTLLYFPELDMKQTLYTKQKQNNPIPFPSTTNLNNNKRSESIHSNPCSTLIVVLLWKEGWTKGYIGY